MVTLTGASAAGDADELLQKVVSEAGSLPLSGLKDALRKADPTFSERRLGYRNFGSFVTAAEARGVIKITGKSDGRMVTAPKKRKSR